MTDHGVMFDNVVWENIPPNSLAALYSDLSDAAPHTAPSVLHLAGVRWITRTGNWQTSSIIDFEPGLPSYDAKTLRRFVRGRRNVNELAIVYCDRSDAKETWDALTEGPDTKLRDYALWWVATLDEITWTPDALAANLAQAWDAPIREDQLFGNQNMPGVNGTSDRSNLFREFHS